MALLLLYIFAANSTNLELINTLAQSYSEKFTSAEDPLLREVAEQTYRLYPTTSMLSGHVQGRFLEMISRLVQPRRILEIGTFTGYSALCLAKGLLKDGLLHTIDISEKDAAVAKANFNKSNDCDKIILHVGNALNIIPGLGETWDLVFIDADKVNYTEYYKLVVPAVREGGLILADNVLFHGEVLQEPVTTKNGKAINAFNEYVQEDNRVEQVLVTIRDGLLLIRKK
jgi:predicted O-methyltransferase YrrM